MGTVKLSLCLFLFLFSLLQRPSSAQQKSYIVYLGGHSHDWNSEASIDLQSVTDSHYDLLALCMGSKEKAKDAIFYSYTKHINGFAANLEEKEALEISKRPEVLSVFPNRMRKLHTTRSWDFLGLERNGEIFADSIWNKARLGEDIIIGNLDTGVWPESKSFDDLGMGPVPTRWKGICQNNTKQGVQCNRKIIGARYFNKGYEALGGPSNDSSQNTARDVDGHGTHTLSTASGGFVQRASIFGFANGTSKGGSPRARVAAYKVCWTPINGSECADADILAAFDVAITDGVDVLSVSLGGTSADYFEDGLAIGAFHAVKNGITVVCSAGNSGPAPGSVSNVAPWILTVGASTIDREFPSIAALGNRKHLQGQSLSVKGLERKFYPLVASSDVKAVNSTLQNANLCQIGALDPNKAKGKIVVCMRGINARVEKGEAVLQAGGAGMILANDNASGNEILADAHVLPATHITFSDSAAVYAYINSTKNPMAYLTHAVTRLNTRPAPFMAAFSSQGPNTITPEILKPDITAPGVSILAAYSEATSPTGLGFDHRHTAFNVESGTSMSCPHVSGIVGLIMAVHPDWSPSAIRSAIMTTASHRDNSKEPIKDASFVEATPFSYGSGHVRPNHAVDPGLIYDLTVNDYLDFMCSIGYNKTQISTFSNQTYTCPTNPLRLTDLNYPSITLPNLSGPTNVTRTVKNVGFPGTYTVRVKPLPGISVSVNPETLKFEKIGEIKTFTVTVEAVKKGSSGGDYVFGMLIWSDGKHFVRSPIVVKVA